MRNEAGNLSKYVITAAELGRLAGLTAREVVSRFRPDDLIAYGGNRFGIPSELARKFLAGFRVDYSFRVIAHMNLRGGIGKTTGTVTVASRACQYGFRTCILDLDPQGSSSLVFDKMPEEGDAIFYDIWQNPSSLLMGSLKTIDENLFILPSSLENSLLDLSLMNPGHQKKAVRSACEEIRAQGFDLVMVDCPPSLGTAVISTICAADIIVIPVCSDAFSFKGLELTLNEIASICDTFNLPGPQIKILFNKFDRRESISLSALERLAADYSNYFVPVTIRTSTEFSKALAKRETVFASPRKSSARDDYDLYVRYLLNLDLTEQKEGGI